MTFVMLDIDNKFEFLYSHNDYSLGTDSEGHTVLKQSGGFFFRPVRVVMSNQDTIVLKAA